jgi:hypothetical protein
MVEIPRAARLLKIAAVAAVMVWFGATSALAAIDYAYLGAFLGYGESTTTTGPCPGGRGAKTTTSTPSYYQNGWVEQVTTVDCNGTSTTTQIPHYNGGYGLVNVDTEVENGGVSAQADGNVTADMYVGNDMDSPTQPQVSIPADGNYHIVADMLEPGTPYTIIFRDVDGRIVKVLQIILAQ